MDGDRPASGDASNTSTDDAFVFPAEDTGEQDPNASLPTSGLKQRVVDAVSRYYETESDLDLPVPTREAIRDQYFEWSYLDRVTAIEHYWLNRPHAFASIVYDPEARAYRYLINEVGLDGGESRSTFDIALQDNVTQPATAVYNISWDRDAMAAQPGVTRVGERLEIVESTDTVDGVVVVTNQAGEPITSATVDIGTTDEGVIEVTTSTTQTDTSGTATAALGVEDTGSTRLYASAGDDTAVLGVDVIGQNYIIESVTATAGGGNAIDVTVDITTDDPNAELLIESLRPDGTVRDSTTVGAADGTYTIAGANQADRVRVTLRDGSGTVRDSVTIDYP